MLKPSDSAAGEAAQVLRPFFFLIPFWGQRYRDYFVNYCLPSLLAPNNLPLLKAEEGHVFLIATTAEDWRAIEALPIMERLREYALPKLLEIAHPQIETAPGSVNAIEYLSICQRKLVEAAYRERAYGSLLWPDLIFSDGVVASLLRHARAGRHLVLVAALRQIQERVLAELSERDFLSNDVPASRSGRPISVPARVLADLQVRHLHSEVAVFEERAIGQPFISPYRYWKMPSGLLLHTFLLQPIMMDFGAIGIHDTDCLDSGVFENVYLGHNFHDRGGLYVVQDSDEFGLLSLTPEAVGVRPLLTNARRPQRGWLGDFVSRGSIRASMKFHAGRLNDRLQRDVFWLPIRCHAQDLDGEWQRQERQVSALIERAVGDCPGGGRDISARWSLIPRYFVLDLAYFSYTFLRRRLPLFRELCMALAGDANGLKRIVGRLGKMVRSVATGRRGT
jgi:hypothetical protein